MTFAVGQYVAYPGIYQYAVQQYPDAPIITASTSGVLGMVRVGGVQGSWNSNNPLWMGFSKVLGTEPNAVGAAGASCRSSRSAKRARQLHNAGKTGPST